MSIVLPPDVRMCIDAHLDAVEKALKAAGISRERRRGIVDDLETQILDMANVNSLDAVTLENIESVLSLMDPPEAYAKVAVLENPASFPPATNG